MTRLTLLLVAVGWMVLALPALAGTAARVSGGLHYRLKARLDPAHHGLEVEAWIRQPPASRFYLHTGLSVRQVMADGKKVAFHRDASAEPLPYAPVGAAVVVETKGCRELYVKYSGEVSDVVSGINMITPDLVELAYYSAWYPIFAGMANYTFEMEVDAPAGFLTTTNGLLKEQQEQEGRLLMTWTSYEPGFDMVLIASPRLHRLEAGVKGSRVEMYYANLPADVLQARIGSLVKGMGWLSDAYGPPRVSGVLRFVYSPRGGWGYSRIPLFVVPEAPAREEMGREHGEARDLHGGYHEMAHFWWVLADPSTPDDWINEGLAEYSAFRLSQQQAGQPFADMLVQEYQLHGQASQTSASIADTEGSSPDREINRYEKTALMLIEAQRRFGQAPLDKVLRSLHTRFAGTLQATTALFLEEVRVQMGAEAEVFFREVLFRKGEVSLPVAQPARPGSASPP